MSDYLSPQILRVTVLQKRKKQSRLMSAAEFKRLATFTGYNSEFVYKVDLAHGGFVSSNNGDEVNCTVCFLKLNHFGENVDPLAAHLTQSKDCSLLKDILKLDVAGWKKDCVAEIEKVLSEDLSESQCYKKLFCLTTQLQFVWPEYPELADAGKRCDSLLTVLKSDKQRCEKLSELGFCATLSGDIICFWCGRGTGRDCEFALGPHLSLNPVCRHARKLAGSDFVAALDEDSCRVLPYNVVEGPASHANLPVSSQRVKRSSRNASDSAMLCCELCRRNTVDVVFLPCRHCIYCQACANKKKPKNCPHCEKEVDYFIISKINNSACQA